MVRKHQKPKEKTKDDAKIYQASPNDNERETVRWELNFFDQVRILNEDGDEPSTDFRKKAPGDNPAAQINAIGKSVINARQFGTHDL